jgi:hypothetical protein
MLFNIQEQKIVIMYFNLFSFIFIILSLLFRTTKKGALVRYPLQSKAMRNRSRSLPNEFLRLTPFLVPSVSRKQIKRRRKMSIILVLQDRKALKAKENRPSESLRLKTKQPRQSLDSDALQSCRHRKLMFDEVLDFSR